MLNQQLLNELQEILEQTCSRKFKKDEVAIIAAGLCSFFELLAEASIQNNERGRNKKGHGGNEKKTIGEKYQSNPS